MTAYVDESGAVVKQKILTISGVNTNTVYKDVWVFDTVVITRTTTGAYNIFEKPIVEGISKTPLVFTVGDQIMPSGVIAYDMAVNVTDEHDFEQYSVATGRIDHLEFRFNET